MDDYGFRTCRWPLKDAFQLMGIHVSDFHDSILPTMVGIFMTPVTRGAIRFPPGLAVKHTFRNRADPLLL
ncbi:hypothetical protein TPY_3487 [Sulfobacillus acidophilus TPY]|uniref:Uncharacterized protein n=1 Tax=Sulfobacillus acidophilus (strain ATCC 700253 / DSM 10332 / NAL) TaxID=679936 RepID=G8TX17_SULAD|nr:hypothetical protein TPY_3487 [Sulfobacillus acidophilus TPY]AEW04925.1 hypothetical protein Sulac_1428 [Sulfobacillus acidophilus DSM 10332]